MSDCVYVMGVYKVCVGDRVSVRVGNRTYSGVVKGVSNYALLLANDNHPVMIKLSKVSVVEVHRPYEPVSKDPLGGEDG